MSLVAEAYDVDTDWISGYNYEKLLEVILEVIFWGDACLI